MVEPTLAALSYLSTDNANLLLWTIVLWWLPGLALSAAFGMRGWLLVAAAPTVTLGMTVVAATVLPVIGVKWTVLSSVVTVVIMLAIALVARGRSCAATALSSQGWSRAGTLAVIAGTAVGAGIGFVTTFGATRGLSALPQHHDPPFQANAIRAIAESGDSRPSALAWIVQGDPSNYYYPNTYHALESIAYLVTGSSVPAVMNASLVVLVALALPLSVVALIRGAGGSARLAAAAAMVSTAFQVFPYDMLGASQLFPYAAGLAVLGGFVGLFSQAVRNGSVVLCVLAAVAATGIAGVHNSAAFVAAIFGVCLLGQQCVSGDWQQTRTCLSRTIGIAGVALVLSLGTVNGAIAASGSVVGTSALPETETPSQSFGEALFLGHNAWWPQMSLALLAIVGGYLMFVGRVWRWMIVAHGTLLFLAMVAQTLPYPWAKLVTAPWWNDRERLHAALALGIIVSAGWTLQTAGTQLATGGIRRGLAPASGRLRAAHAQWVPAICGVASGALLLTGYLSITDGYVPRNTDRVAVSFGDDIISAQQRAGMAALPQVVPPGQKVINDISDGSVWTYALSGIKPMFSHYDSEPHRAQRIILEGLNRLDSDPLVRQAVARTAARYVAIRTDGAENRAASPGMKNLEDVGSLVPIWCDGGLRVYRIVLPSQGPPPSADSARAAANSP